MGFIDRKVFDAVRRPGNERRDGGRFPDAVFRVTVTEAEATEKYDRKMFVGVGWFDVKEDGKSFRMDKQKLLRAEEIPEVMRALASAQQFIDNDGEGPAVPEDSDAAPF